MDKRDVELNRCENCGEPVKEHWKICPVCEIKLPGLACSGCRSELKPNWKLCPECGQRVICSQCGKRLPVHDDSCSCRSEVKMPLPKVTEPLTGMEFIYVPGALFTMGDFSGSGLGNELPLHEVALDGFYMGKTLVTQGMWEKIMGNNPSAFPLGEDHPVEQVSYQDILRFIKKLTERSGLNQKFQLPTEAQWEYAARSGGRDETYAGGENPDVLAWHGENSSGHTRPVATAKPNGLGLYDMSGNVWEWCRDIYLPDAYKKHETKNPLVTGGSVDRVARGGSWNMDTWSIRCTRRFTFPVEMYGSALGFRLVFSG